MEKLSPRENPTAERGIEPKISYPAYNDVTTETRLLNQVVTQFLTRMSEHSSNSKLLTKIFNEESIRDRTHDLLASNQMC